jgi:thioredoxin 1
MAKELTDQTFEKEVEKTKGSAMVDFWAPWCGPCQITGPIIEELSKEYEGKVLVGKLEVDHNPKTAQKYNVFSIPTVLYFKDGKVVDSVVGAQGKEVFEEKLEKLTGT